MPIFVAGDLTHHWKATPELINFLLAYMPTVYAVAGNHDLPYHDYDQRHRSAYWTLVEAGAVKNLAPGEPQMIGVGNPEGDLLWVQGFPWGTPLSPVPDPDDHLDDDGQDCHLDLAVVHDYCWQEGRGSYPGVDPGKHFKKHMEYLGGYDVMLFGDNHQPFKAEEQGQGVLVNAGAMIPRRSDEKMAGLVWVLCRDGSVRDYVLMDNRCAPWVEVEDVYGLGEAGLDLESAVDLLQRLGAATLDFGEAVREYLSGPGRGLPGAVATLVVDLVERAREAKRK